MHGVCPSSPHSSSISSLSSVLRPSIALSVFSLSFSLCLSLPIYSVPSVPSTLHPHTTLSHPRIPGEGGQGDGGRHTFNGKELRCFFGPRSYKLEGEGQVTGTQPRPAEPGRSDQGFKFPSRGVLNSVFRQG